MSDRTEDRVAVTVLGAGCAALSLAARAAEFDSHDFTIIDPETHKAGDHIWGFWAMPWLGEASAMTRKKWFKWRIISPDRMVNARRKTIPIQPSIAMTGLTSVAKRPLPPAFASCVR